MIRNNHNHQNEPQADESQGQSAGGACRSHGKLNEWQIRQYRRAVDENMWYMGERLGRPVSWEEAEYDFLHNGYYGCAPRWRKEYCAERCLHIDECSLGKLFLKH